MTAYELIFSEKRKVRIARHLAFWAAYCLYTFVDHFSSYGFANFFEPFFYQNVVSEIAVFFPVYFFSVYTTLYFIFPKCILPGKTGLIILSFLCVGIISSAACYFIYDIFLIPDNNQQERVLAVITQTSQQFFGKGIVITGMALIIKLAKYYYVKQKEHEQLMIENARNKLQIIKSNLHPQIIFESLQRIEKDIDAGTVYAPEMILLLSDLLSYLLYKANEEAVLLNEEIRMINDFIKLKTIGHNNETSVDFVANVDDTVYWVPTLIFLPLVEVAFAIRNETENANTIAANLTLNNSTLHFSIHHSNAGISAISNNHFYVIENIEKRLQTIFPNQHKMVVSSALENFSVELALDMKNIKGEIPAHSFKKHPGELA